MEPNIIIFLIVFAVVLVVIGFVLGNRYFVGIRLANMEKKLTEYFNYEGYEWKKEDGVLNVKRAGVNFRVFLNGEEKIKSTSVWIQYGTQLEEDLAKMNWVGQTLMVNVLNDRHPALNVSMNTEDHVLWVHYRADIRSKEEFAYHFNGAFNEMKSLMNDYSDMLPKLQQDFPAEDKTKKHIGFA